MQTLRPDDRNIKYYEYDVHVYYCEQKFTGIIKDEWEQTEYNNGLPHGQSLSFFQTGEIRERNIFHNGELLKTTKYFKNGVLNSELNFEPYSYRVWNINSILVRDNKTFYYANGQIRKQIGDALKDDYLIKAYSKRGDLMFTVQKDVWVDGQFVRNVKYEDEVLLDCYFEALVEENPELADTEEKNDTHYVWMWFWTIFEKESDKYLQILNKLMTHPSKEVIGTVANIIASHKYNEFIADETKNNSECYKLISEYTFYQNKNFPNRQIKQLKRE